MAVPERTLTSLASVKRVPVFAIDDSGDSNPVFWVTDSGLRLALGVNYNALLDSSGKISVTNFFTANSLTETQLPSPTGNTKNALRMGKWTYSFAVNGGGTGTIAMTGETLPVNAVVIGGILDVTTAITGGATVAIQLQSANDIISAAADSGAPWSTTGIKAIVPVFTAATSKKVATTAKTPSLVVTVAAITAGIFNLTLVYGISDA